MSNREEFLSKYGHELETYEHPRIAELLYYKGRQIITGTKGIQSPTGGNPFLGNKCSAFMKVLWLLKNSEGNHLTYKHLSHYLGENEHSISRRLNYAKLSYEYTNRVEIIKNGKVKLRCIDSSLFPDNDDVSGFKELALLIKHTEDKSLIVKKEKPPVTASNRYDTLFITVISWIRFCDGQPIQTKRKRIIDDKEYGISIDEIVENTGWSRKQIVDEIKRILTTMLKQYIGIIEINGVHRYYMNAEGRSHTLSQLREIAQLTWDDGRLLSKIQCSSLTEQTPKKVPVFA